MDTLYILRLPQQMRNTLTRVRNELYQNSGDSSFCSLEACIILGPVQAEPKTGWIDSPPLPLITEGSARFSHGMLFLPIAEQSLQAIRRQLETDYPISGIYLGKSEQPLVLEPLGIKDLSLARLSWETHANLVRWRIFSETHLDSGTNRPTDSARTQVSLHDTLSGRTN
ncbi:MAG: hypothetical protein AB7C91_05640 [Sphaerochaeta sp.]|uniref:hypothetical protein n=1 Tax=Sphaerochaeta sp. TaxID=1972642 RepID=UPI003D0E6198